jgi:hypothetical protein
MNEDPGMPPELWEVDRALRGVRFCPRASLGPEVLGRLRHGERATAAVSARRRHPAIAAIAAALLLVTAAALALRAPGPVEVDRCCYDLDGGADADDGVVVLARRNAKVHQLRVYEDLDGSRSFTDGDLIRLDRGETAALHGTSVPGLVTIEHCCVDFDGGGPADDGLIVIGVPPDRVVMAAIYETSPGAEGQRAGSGGSPLR